MNKNAELLPLCQFTKYKAGLINLAQIPNELQETNDKQVSIIFLTWLVHILEACNY